MYDGGVEFLASVIELGDLGGGNMEENKVIYPFEDGADPLSSEDVCTSIHKVAVDVS